MKDTGGDDASGAFGGVKAAHMAGMLGDTGAAMEIVKELLELKNAEVREAAVLAIDHAVQKDGAAVADALQRLIEQHPGDAEGPLATTIAEQVVYRLRSR